MRDQRRITRLIDAVIEAPHGDVFVQMRGVEEIRKPRRQQRGRNSVAGDINGVDRHVIVGNLEEAQQVASHMSRGLVGKTNIDGPTLALPPRDQGLL